MTPLPIFYVQACETLNAAGVQQYEISNFAREGRTSQHNLKYWLRQPYFGFGVDAHSMLISGDGEAVRIATADDLDAYLGGTPHAIRYINRAAAEDEAFFLGLRLNRGIDLSKIAEEFGANAIRKREDSLRTFGSGAAGR